MCAWHTGFLVFFMAALRAAPSIDDTVYVREWYLCGPFSLGAREGVIGADPEIEIDPLYEPDTVQQYMSILAPGGTVQWTKFVSDSGEIQIGYDNIPWDTLQDYYGIAGVLCGTYAYGELTCSERSRALVVARGVSSFRINGVPCHGDPYEDGFALVPVLLDSGTNRILLKLSGYGSHRCFLQFIPCNAPVRILEDITAPDIVRGDTSMWFGVPLLNAADTWLTDIRVRIAGSWCAEGTRDVPVIAPLSIMKIPLHVQASNTRDFPDDSVQVFLSVMFDSCSVDTAFWLQVKDRDEAHVRTFLSHIDYSCQYYAVLPPCDYREGASYACIMTCHGAGVKAENQVRAYEQKHWAYVVAPTNRRRFGFDWQDWGRLDFLEVFEDVKKHFQIDTARVYLTGHSMGGHGVWHIATRHPNLFAAIAPSAGWTTFPLYIPWFLQKSEIFADPECLKIRATVMREDDPLVHLDRLDRVPVYILQGGVDDNVPPIHGRMFAKYLDALGCDYVYNEVPAMGHWWDVDSTPGAECVDLESLMDFLKEHTRQPRLPKKEAEKNMPLHTIKQAYYEPFILVYGTTGDSISTYRNLNQARYQAFAWWYRANGYCSIVPDTAVTPRIIETYNLILFGNAGTNFIISRINDKLPVHSYRDRCVVGAESVPGPDLGLVVIYPNPLHRGKLVCLFSPTSHEAEKFIGAFNPLYSGSGLPDFIVYDRSVLQYGWGGLRAAGLFDRDWKVDPVNSYVK